MDEEAKSAATAEGNGVVSTPAAFPDEEDNWNRELQRKMEVKVLEDIESMEERVCHASLQVKDRKSGVSQDRVRSKIR